MKTRINGLVQIVFWMVLLLLLFHVAKAGAADLVSDPPGPCGASGTPACPVSADIYIDGAVVAEKIALQPDLSIRYNLGAMPQNEHEYTAKYYDSLGRASADSNPFLLLEVVAAPLNLRGEPSP